MKTIIPAVLIAIMLSACGAGNVKESKPNVTSNPVGADVYAEEKRLGKTPLKINLYKHFPTSWKNWVLSARGTLAIKKAGCEDYSLEVNDAVLSRPIHANLKCNPAVVYKREVPVVAQPKPKAVVKPAPLPARKTATGIEKRLKELSKLYEKGVITKEEYQSTRKRILSEM